MPNKDNEDLVNSPQKKRQILRLNIGSSKKSLLATKVVKVKNKKPSVSTGQDSSNTIIDKKSLDRANKILERASHEDTFFNEDNILDKLRDVKNTEDGNQEEEKNSEPKKTGENKEENHNSIIEQKENITKKESKSNYNFSGDINEKLKKSLQIEEEKKKEREEKVKEIKEEKEEKNISNNFSKKKHKKKFNNNEGESSSDNKVSRFKLEKNRRKSQKTYIIDEKSGSSHYTTNFKKREKRKNKDKGSYDKINKEVKISDDPISVESLAEKMAEKSSEVVKKLFSIGSMVTVNQSIDAETAEIIIGEFGHKCIRVKEVTAEEIFAEDNKDVERKTRPPVVTIMGHVDHGKTSILDAIRSTNIAAKESGGITQHVGAFNVATKNGKEITFLDTPGHEAFTEMRSRGANVTDIVILVVAADDGVKNQTIEAINHAKAAEVPIIVAVNKIDKPQANPANVKNELLSHDIISEDLGGEVIFVEVSAKEKTNLDKLEEAILLQADIMELDAPYDCKARGIIIESKIDKHKGVVTSAIVQEGILKISDLIVAGTAIGKIKTITKNQDENITSASPSVAVDILGLDKAPNAGDKFAVIKNEKTAREIVGQRIKDEQEKKGLNNNRTFIKDAFKAEGEKTVKQLPLIVKGDVSGSVEAIIGSMLKLNNEEVEIKIVHHATGGINESDINLATVTDSTIIGFNVRPNSQAKAIAKTKGINIIYNSIIYNVIDDIKKILGGMLGFDKKENILGNAEIRQVFKISGVGNIAGCMVINKDSIIKRGAKARLLRDDVVIYDGAVSVLKRFKDDVKEVKTGFECGISLENYSDIKVGDIVEAYEIIEKQRSL